MERVEFELVAARPLGFRAGWLARLELAAGQPLLLPEAACFRAAKQSELVWVAR